MCSRPESTLDSIQQVLLYQCTMTHNDVAHVLRINAALCSPQPLTAMPECSQSSKRQRPDYLAGFTSGSSADNSCSSSEEDEEGGRKSGGGREGEKKEKKVSYDLGDKEKHKAERSGKATLFSIYIYFLKAAFSL